MDIDGSVVRVICTCHSPPGAFTLQQALQVGWRGMHSHWAQCQFTILRLFLCSQSWEGLVGYCLRKGWEVWAGRWLWSLPSCFPALPASSSVILGMSSSGLSALICKTRGQQAAVLHMSYDKSVSQTERAWNKVTGQSRGSLEPLNPERGLESGDGQMRFSCLESPGQFAGGFPDLVFVHAW